MIWLLTAFTFHALAGTILLQGPQTSPLEYKAMLKAHGNLTSPSQEYLNTHPALANREHLLTLFAEAQKSFLEKSNEEARAKFESVLTLLTHDDWEKSDREVFFQTYLRLAQMETAAGNRDRWLGLSLLLGEINYDSSLFPPPLLARRTELLQSLPKKDVARRMLGLGWSHILINGQICKKGDCTAWPLYPGQVRMTVLSDQWLPQTMVFDLAEIDHLTPSQFAWAEGNCENEKLARETAGFADKKVFWGLNCAKPEVAVNLKPSIVPQQPLPLFTTAAPKSAPIYHSKWFWAGVTAAVAVIVIASSKKKETKEPSTTYDF
ncbi:MAG: hypothetical protein ACXVA9_00160 [Bdellovibrionales bacterium]